MKTFLLIFIAACCLLSCKKSSISSGLVGKWELRRQYGGLAAYDSVYKAGNGTIFQFNRDSTYKAYNKGTLYSQGNFHIKIVGYNSTTSFYGAVLFDNVNLGTEAISLDDTKLTLGTTVTDGLAADYAKIGN